jgi:quercetin dioxygenase-like cupin family protein
MLTDESKIGGAKTVSKHARKPVSFVEKGWGGEVWFANNELYCGKLLRFEKGKRCSLHYHKIKTESFYLHTGKLLLRVMESPEATTVEEFELGAGDCMDLPPGLVHQMVALEDSELFEFSTQHFEEDSYRLVKGD